LRPNRAVTAAGVSLLLAGVLLGLLLDLVLSPGSRGVIPVAGQDPAEGWAAVEKLESEQHDLRARAAELRSELLERQQVAAASVSRLEALQDEVDRQRLLAGLLPVLGPGVVVTLDDSAVRVQPGSDPNAYIIHEYDLRDIVNLLWLAGSEAVAVNDERLVNSSSLYCVGSTVMVNNSRLSPPYLIRAVGDPRLLLDFLRNPSYLADLKEKRRLYGLRFDFVASNEIGLPAYRGGVIIQYARPGD